MQKLGAARSVSRLYNIVQISMLRGRLSDDILAQPEPLQRVGALTKWREIFGFDGEDLDFETVHTRYRERALQLSELATWKACKP
jgi:hypothetical protein